MSADMKRWRAIIFTGFQSRDERIAVIVTGATCVDARNELQEYVNDNNEYVVICPDNGVTYFIPVSKVKRISIVEAD